MPEDWAQRQAALDAAVEDWKKREKTVHVEKATIAEALDNGNFGVEKFGGQTYVWIPKDIFDALGFERIHEIAKGVFNETEHEITTVEEMEEYNGPYTRSHWVQLPSAFVDDPEREVKNGFAIKDNGKIEQFINAVRAAYAEAIA